jgi:hypothetical protein
MTNLLPCILLSALTANLPQAEAYNLLGAAVTVEAPSTWHFLGKESDRGEDALFFHFRVPAMDTVSKDRTNIIVRARPLPPRSQFEALTDTTLGAVIQSGAAVLSDTLIGATTRAVLWRGELRGTPYVILDKFGLVQGIFVYIRSAMPLRSEFTSTDQRKYMAELDQFFRSVTVHMAPAFPEGSGISIQAF